MAKRKLAPWEAERKRKRERDYQRLYRAGKIDIDERRSFGRGVGKKPKKNVCPRDIASFACPKCRNNVTIDLIRLRQDLYECRKCKHTFIKENIIDEFDFDYDK